MSREAEALRELTLAANGLAAEGREAANGPQLEEAVADLVEYLGADFARTDGIRLRSMFRVMPAGPLVVVADVLRWEVERQGGRGPSL